MKRYFYLSLSVVMLTSCLSRHEVLRNPQAGKRHPPQRTIGKTTPPRTSTSGNDYIAKYKDIAIVEMNTHGIPASIKLAQALLESGNGNSALAREANNHFGIKCTPNWGGGKIYKDDDKIDDCFRVYRNAEDSFRDHSEFLLRNRYAKLFTLDKGDYKGWARGLKDAGYATNPRYAELLINLIERYDLQRYDGHDTRTAKIQRQEIVLGEIIEKIPEETQAEQAMPPVDMVIHEVKQGDTLSSISRKYGLTVQELVAINGLKNEALQIGQMLLVSN